VKIPFKPLLTLCLILAATESHAGPPSICTGTTTSVNFGAYDIFAAAQTASTGTITIICTMTVNPATITIGASANSGVFIPRQMIKSGGTELLNYNLFIDPSYLTVWGDGTQGTSSWVGKIQQKNFSYNIPVYGSIPAGQDVSAGIYTDTLVVTVSP